MSYAVLDENILLWWFLGSRDFARGLEKDLHATAKKESARLCLAR
jgi:hypothetical protein